MYRRKSTTLIAEATKLQQLQLQVEARTSQLLDIMSLLEETMAQEMSV